MQDLLESFTLSEDVPKNIVHNTELLLKLYRKVEFAVKCHLRELDEELMEILNLSRSTYYRQKKKAIELYAAVLWSLSLPKPPDKAVNTCQNKAS